MRPSVLVALIICGTLLVMTPAIADHLKNRQDLQAQKEVMAVLAARTDVSHWDFTRTPPLEDTMKFGLWFTGSMAILAGAIGGFVGHHRETRARQAAN